MSDLHNIDSKIRNRCGNNGHYLLLYAFIKKSGLYYLGWLFFKHIFLILFNWIEGTKEGTQAVFIIQDIYKIISYVDGFFFLLLFCISFMLFCIFIFKKSF